MLRAMLISLLLIGCSPSALTSKERFINDLRLIRIHLLKAVPGLNESDDLQRSLLIRAYLRDHVVRGSTPNPDFTRPLETFLNAINDHRYGYVCGGMAILYLYALEAMGIPARYIGLYGAIDYSMSHATVEVYIDGHWIASDPHYDVSYVQGDNYLSYGEMRASRGSWLRVDGYSTLGPSPSELDSNEFAYLNYITTYHIDIEGFIETTYEPETWDGFVNYDGTAFNTKMTGFYIWLAEGPIRNSYNVRSEE